MKIINLPVDSLIPNPLNNTDRYIDSEVRIMADSIKERGIVQPIVLAEDEKTIMVGHRRWAGARLAGLKTVPCRVTDWHPTRDWGCTDGPGKIKSYTPRDWLFAWIKKGDIAVRHAGSLNLRRIKRLFDALGSREMVDRVVFQNGLGPSIMTQIDKTQELLLGRGLVVSDREMLIWICELHQTTEVLGFISVFCSGSRSKTTRALKKLHDWIKRGVPVNSDKNVTRVKAASTEAADRLEKPKSASRA